MRKPLPILYIITAAAIFTAFNNANAGSIPWISFYWSPIKNNGKTLAKGVLLVPIKIRSFPDTYYVQLDTGASATIFYSVPKSIQDELVGNWEKGQAFHLPLHIGSSVLTFTGIMIKTSPAADMSTPHPLIGTLGQNAFLNRVVFIDFIHQRIALLRLKQVKQQYLAGVSFVHMTYRNNELFIPLSLGRRHYPDDFFYDSGSSLFSLITTRPLWERMTGRSLDDPKNDIMNINDWGQTATMVGAEARDTLSIGPIRVASPMIYFQKSANSNNIANAKYPVKGVVGNALFYDCCMIVIDAPHKRFGIKKIKP